jgi:hypothetical protein
MIHLLGKNNGPVYAEGNMKKRARIYTAAGIIVIVAAAVIFFSINNTYLSQVAFSFKEIASKTVKDKRENIGDNFNRHIKIGVVGSKDLMEMTGFLNGIRLAEEELKKAGGLAGRDFEIAVMDDKDEITIRDIEQELCFTGTNAYYHLSLMIKANMIKTRNQGRTILYSINKHYFDVVCEMLGKYSNKK